MVFSPPDRPGQIVPPDDEMIIHAGQLLARGALVAFPTETVYGLGADATNDEAVARVFEVKGRPEFNPLIAHVFDVEQAATLVDINDTARRLCARFWPGPLSIVLPRKKECPVSYLATAGLDTLAVRMPDHGVARELIEALGKPIVAPSANRSGKISPTNAEAVAEELGAKVAIILDGGPCRRGLESTVVAVRGGELYLLRHGALPAEEIESVAGTRLLSESDAGPARSPGRLMRHYLPDHPVRLNADSVGPEEGLLAFGKALAGAAKTLNLSPGGDLREAAANLFAMLRALDKATISGIAVMPVPDEGLGRAINDRLARAASTDEK